MFAIFLNFCLSGTSLPIRRGLATVTIDDREWDLTSLKSSTFSSSIDDEYFYIKFADSVTASELPSYASIYDHGNVYKCNTTDKKCYVLTNIYDYDWIPIKPTNLGEGVTYVAQGAPISQAHKFNSYQSWEVRFQFHCNANVEMSAPVISVNQLSEQNKRLYLKFDDKRGCPTKALANLPTPTPAFKADSHATFRHPEDTDQVIDFDIKELNGGPLGVRTYVQNSNGEKKFLFVAPADRMVICPYGAQCDAQESTAWYCTEDMKTCESYALQNNEETSMIEVDLIDDTSLFEGIYLKYYHPTSDKTVRVNLLCDSNVPEGRILFSPENSQVVDNNIIVQGYAKEACPKSSPVPVPPADKCVFKYQQTGSNWQAQVDLKNLNLDGGWYKRVKNTAMLSQTEYDLYYQPCGALVCPDKADCDGDEDATVWLCETPKGTLGETIECDGYGLYKNDVTASINNGYVLNGFDVSYKGDLGRTAEINLRCNKSLISGQLYISNNIYLKGNTLNIDVDSLDVCASGTGPTPTPPPRVIPQKPTLGRTPTPTPIPSPNPVNIIVNDTHYIIVDLSIAQEEVLRKEMSLYANRRRASIYTEYSAWDLIPCPQGWNCGDFDYANLWQCWYDEDFNPYCHPVADKRIPGQKMSLLNDGNLDTGVMVTSEGAYGVNMEIRALCDPSSNIRHTIPIKDSMVTYHVGMDGAEFSFDSTTKAVCPKKFETPVAPSRITPTPTPDPSQKIDYTFNGIIDDSLLSLDLTKLKAEKQTVYLGVGEKYHKAEIFMTPGSLSSCPKGYTCNSDIKQGNIWKCIDGKTCWPIGDAHYGLHFSFVDDDNHMAGVAVNYDGGYGKYETHVIFQCNTSVPKNTVHLAETGAQGRQNVVVLYGHTPDVCPQPGYGKKPVSGGAVFLLIIILIIVLYFGLGTVIKFITTGTISLPNEEFWSQFWNCIKATVLFLVKCEKPNNYNEI